MRREVFSRRPSLFGCEFFLGEKALHVTRWQLPGRHSERSWWTLRETSSSHRYIGPGRATACLATWITSSYGFKTAARTRSSASFSEASPGE